jgi:hypothetical protein
MLSMHRRLPSMLIITPCRFRLPVKSSLVNLAALVGIEDLRPAVAWKAETYVDLLDAHVDPVDQGS